MATTEPVYSTAGGERRRIGWRARSRVGGGKASVGPVRRRKRDADADGVELDRQRSTGQGVRGYITVADAIEDHLERMELKSRRDRERQLAWWRDHLGATTRLQEIHSDRVAAGLERLRRKGLASSTRNRYLSALSKLMREARVRRLRSGDNPCADLKAPEPPARDRFIDRERELPVLLDAFGPLREEWAGLNQSHGPIEVDRLRLWLELALDTWARRSEIMSLRRQDVDVAGRQVVARDTKVRGEDRVLHISEPTAERLAEWMQVSRIDTELVMVHRHTSLRSGQTRAPWPRKPWEKLLELAGLAPGIKPHTVRHSAATWGAEMGMSAFQIQELGGWRSIQTAARYTHVGQRQAKAKSREYHDFLHASREK